MILMAPGTTKKMTTISTKRARQRAKAAAADGGSHQSALDGIARAEGHAHWGAKLRSDGADASVSVSVPADFLSRRWAAGRPDATAGIVAFVAAALAGTSSQGIRPVLARFLASAWFSERPEDVADDLPTFVLDMMAAATDEHRRRVEEAGRMNAYCRDTPDGILVDMMTEEARRIGYPSIDLSMVRHATASEVLAALRGVVETARWMSASPLAAVRSISVAVLDDRTIADVVVGCWGDAVPDLVAIQAVSEMIDDPGFTTRADAELALGSDVAAAAILMEMPGLPRDRRQAVTRLVLDAVPSRTDWRITKHDGVLSRLVSSRPDSLMARWLQHAYERIISGRVPYSFNPLVGDGLASCSTDDAMRDAVVVLLEVLESGSCDSAMVEDVVRLVADVLAVIRGAERIDEFQRGLTPSFPSVMSVLVQAGQQPGQLELFATFNRMDPALVDRLRTSSRGPIANHALAALAPFRNPAIARAAS